MNNTPERETTDAVSPSADDHIATIFGAVLEGKSEPLLFYGLGHAPETIPDLTADKLDKALALVRLGEKWDERAAFDKPSVGTIGYADPRFGLDELQGFIWEIEL